jgi:hypothetical protein
MMILALALLLGPLLAQTPTVAPSVPLQIAQLIVNGFLAALGSWISFQMWKFIQGQVHLDSNQQARADTATAQAIATARKLDASNANQSLVRKEAAYRAEQVRRTLEVATSATDRKLDELARASGEQAIVGAATHALVNSGRGELLKEAADDSKARALESPTPDNLRKAELYEARWRAHQDAQLVVDAQPGTDDQKRGMAADPGAIPGVRPPIAPPG